MNYGQQYLDWKLSHFQPLWTVEFMHPVLTGCTLLSEDFSELKEKVVNNLFSITGVCH